MRSGSWGFIALIYALSVMAAAAIGMMAPIAGDIARTFNVSPEQVGLAIAGQLIPLAFAGLLMGWLIDRFGPRLVLWCGGALMLLAGLSNGLADRFGALQLSLLLEGIALVAMITTGQTLMMISTEGRRQVQALSLLSTAMPAGFAVGLLLIAPFAGSTGWQHGFLAHAAAFGVLLLASAGLPASRVPPGQRGIGAVLRNPAVLRLGLAMAIGGLTSFGSSSVLPLVLERSQGLPVASSARYLALASLLGILGSLVIGGLLARGVAPARNTLLVAAVATLGALGVFLPGSPLAAAMGGAVLLQLAAGGFVALCFSLLPRVVASPAQAGTAAGLMGQISGIGAGLSAPVFFAVFAQNRPFGFVVLMLVCWAGFLLAMPVWGSAAARRLQAAA